MMTQLLLGLGAFVMVDQPWPAADAAGAAVTSPTGLAVAGEGTVWVADAGTHRVVQLSPDGGVATLGGLPPAPFRLYHPEGVALAPDGTLYVADTGRHVVWELPLDAPPVQTVAVYGRLARCIDQAGQRLETALPLARDVFWSVVKAVPRLDPPAPLTPAHELNRQLMGELLGTREWREVRAAGTVGDPLTSAMATIGVVGRVLAALDDDTLRQYNELAGLEQELDDLLARAATLDDLAAQVGPEKAEALQAQADLARQHGAAAQQRAAALQQALAAYAEERADAVRRAARAALAEAAAEIDAATQAIAAFGGGYGVGPGPGADQVLNTRDKIAIAGRVAADPTLRQIATLAGRLTRIALHVQATRVQHPPDEIAAIATGDDLGRVLPSELALLADDATEDLFWARLVERRLLTYQLIGHEPLGKGPIVLSVDNSGSMAGQKECWAKAVALALLAIAAKQRRDLAVLHFGGTPDELRVFRFPRGQASPSDTLACMSHFYGGGTEFQTWMRTALHLIDEAAFDRADVICITDGLVAIEPDARTAWQERRRQRGLRCFSILIGGEPAGARVLTSISDMVLTLDLADDNEVLRTIFAI